MAEEVVWEGRPSQIVNAPVFAFCAVLSLLVGPFLSKLWTGAPAFVRCAVFAFLVAPILIALWKWLVVRCIDYQLTSERLRVHTGVLSRTMDELELYRVKDTRFEQPFWLRLFRLGNLIVQTSDRTDPVVTLCAIADGLQVREKVRAHVETLRERKRVLEID